jgi:hypothetical protein
MRGSYLAKCVQETRQFVDGFRKIWRETGCTIMADGWTDRKRRTLINFLVYCPKGNVFLKSVDATDSSKTGDFLFRLFKDVVNHVGPENVVHFVTNNASNMVAAAGRKLEDEFPSIYWSACAAHCTKQPHFPVLFCHDNTTRTDGAAGFFFELNRAADEKVHSLSTRDESSAAVSRISFRWILGLCLVPQIFREIYCPIMT